MNLAHMAVIAVMVLMVAGVSALIGCWYGTAKQEELVQELENELDARRRDVPAELRYMGFGYGPPTPNTTTYATYEPITEVMPRLQLMPPPITQPQPDLDQWFNARTAAFEAEIDAMIAAAEAT